MKKTLPLPARVRRLVPYASARSLYKGDDWTFLDANESPFSPTTRLSALSYNRYPDPTADQLRDAIGKTFRLARGNIMMASGSDEIIDLITRCFVRSGRSVAAIEPSYGMYSVSARTNGVPYAPIALESDWRPPSDMTSRCGRSDVLFLCNPNNPTGGVIAVSTIAKICRSFPGIVVVDEAYGEFADALGYPSCMRLLRKGVKNLIVLRTFSKAFGAAGIRLGYALSDPAIIAVLLNCKLPYNVNALTQAAGLALWKNRSRMERSVKIILKERTRLMRRCAELGFTPRQSAANFFLVQCPTPLTAARAFEGLVRAGIIVRRMKSLRLRSFLRFTVGTRAENDMLLSSLSSLL